MRSPRWWVAHLLVISTCVLFVNLGFWQIRRLEQRRLENTIWQSRMDTDPLPIEDVLRDAGGDMASLEYLRVVARGTFSPTNEIRVRSQVYQGAAGFHLITPLVLEDGTAVLVNRGWIPLDMATVELPVDASAPNGPVEIFGLIRLSQIRRGIGPTDPAEGPIAVAARVDIARLAPQMPFQLVPVFIEAQNGGPGGPLPKLIAPPDTHDEGPHLSYAIQWFAFAAIGAVGYLFLLRRALARKGIDVEGEAVDHLG